MKLGIVGIAALAVVLAGCGGSSASTAAPHASASASPSSQATPPLASTTAPVVPPPAAPPPAALAVHITASTYGHVEATTSPGATCRASAMLPSGNPSTAAGLQVAQTAGSGGAVGWTYRTTTRTGKGAGTHSVSCQLGGQSAGDSAPFAV